MMRVKGEIMDIKTKVCSKCGIEKFTGEFGRDKYNKDGLNSRCKYCIRTESAAWKKANPDKVKQHRSRYNDVHADQRNKYNLDWNQTNVERMREIRRRSYYKLGTTVKGKLDNRMHSAIYQSLRSNKAGKSWKSMVGYSVEDLKQHLESKFLPGMSWDNMHLWHIDHIVPKSFFIYNTHTDQEFQYCWSLDNLQPLWAEDNLSKGATYANIAA
jgi:hypothetical protein